jgi:UDP-N-acetylmuramate dehydrogenase
MEIKSNYPLKSFNTFGLEARAAQYIEVNATSDVIELAKQGKFKDDKTLILGGGSNILLCDDVDGLVIKNNIKFIQKVTQTENHISVKVGAGEVWHNLVLISLDNNWFGLENMSLIPGTVGAAPMQNIGAYGSEIKDVFESLEAVDRETGEVKIFTNEECQFGYRESIFKNVLKNKYFIVSVTLKLNLEAKLNTSYGAINTIIKEKGIQNPEPKDISDAVIHIRQSKLPDPSKIGNSGSFFKNPEIPNLQFEELKKKFENIVGYPLDNGKTKVPAGWLIENAGWKGFRDGDIGVHKNQALVLVNYGSGKGKDIYDLALRIKASIFEKYDIEINPEVNIIG